MLTGAVAAQQVAFSSRYVGNSVRFDYRWKDADAVERSLAFMLPIDDLKRGSAEFQPLDTAQMNNAAFEVVQQYARANSSDTLKLNVERTFQGVDIKAEGPRGAAGQAAVARHMEAIQTLREKAVDDYITNALYSRIDATHVMPDHRRLVQRYAPALAPVQAAMRVATRGMDERAVANYVMGFLQTIPYDTLHNRYTSNGAGFQTPYGVLLGNKGDCDSKSVAMLALLRGLLPHVRLTMIYVHEHAFVGLAIPRTANDFALKLGNAVFVLADPTGPRLLKVGEVDGTALAELERGKYSYQEVLY